MNTLEKVVSAGVEKRFMIEEFKPRQGEVSVVLVEKNEDYTN